MGTNLNGVKLRSDYFTGIALVITLAALILFPLACSPAPSRVDPTDGAVRQNDTGIETPPFVPDTCKVSLSAKTEVVVGAGQTFYSAIDEGAVLTWEKGPQGGHHVWIALRQEGLRQQGTIATIDLDDIENPAQPININHSKVVYDFSRDPDGGNHCVLSGLRMQIDNAGGEPLSSLLNHHVRVTVSLKDSDGSQASGTKTIVVTGKPL
ncbi:MAG: hypothetical protein NVSMB1_07730 [Polyangiales bacterium]